MKATSTALKAHMAQPVTTLATLWRVTRRDGVAFGFTDHDRDIVFNGVTHQARTGMSASEFQSNSSLSVDNIALEGFFDSAVITAADMEAGVWDGASLRVSVVNYADLTMGEDVQLVGELGQFSAKDQVYIAEARGLSDRLSRTITRLYMPSCDAVLGDSRCGYNIEAARVAGAVTSVTSAAAFVTNLGAAVGTYDYGVITWTSGLNTGRKMDVKRHTTGGAIELQLPMASAVTIGDAFTIVPGCDKTFSECRTRFSNGVNFRGFPHVPGLDEMMQPGGVR